MKEGTKKLSDDEMERKINAVLGLIDILVIDERAKWYLAGLIDGYKIHHRRM